MSPLAFRLAAAMVAAVLPTLAASAQISHNLTPNNGLSSGASVYFDLDVADPQGIVLRAIDVFTSVSVTPFQLVLSLRSDTHQGTEGGASGWVTIATASAMSASSTQQATTVVLPAPVPLAQGLHGVKLQYVGVGPRYRTLAVHEVVSAYAVSLRVGASRSTTAADPWAGVTLSPRGFSGTIHFDGSVPWLPATVDSYGELGTTSQGTEVRLDADDLMLGGTAQLAWKSGPAPSISALLLGFQRATVEIGNVLQQVGGVFGQILVVEMTQETTVFSTPFPNDPSWLGAQLHWQAAVLDVGLSPLPATFSNGVTTVVGSAPSLPTSELDLELDPEDQDVACPGGQTRYRVYGWRRQHRGRGVQTVEVRLGAVVVTSGSVAPGCLQGKLYTDEVLVCLPTNPTLTWVYVDCDAAPVARSVPGAAIPILGPQDTVQVAQFGPINVGLPGSWGQTEWSSSRPHVLSIAQGVWTAHQSGRARITCAGTVLGPNGPVHVRTSRWIRVE